VTSAEAAAVMTPDWTLKRTLGSDDKAAAAAIY
jgi:hypothetical protein